MLLLLLLLLLRFDGQGLLRLRRTIDWRQIQKSTTSNFSLALFNFLLSRPPSLLLDASLSASVLPCTLLLKENGPARCSWLWGAKQVWASVNCTVAWTEMERGFGIDYFFTFYRMTNLLMRVLTLNKLGHVSTLALMQFLRTYKIKITTFWQYCMWQNTEANWMTVHTRSKRLLF